MKKSEYIQKAKNTILNRVRFHAPVVYDDKIDKKVLFLGGVDVNLPVFKFDKTLNKNLLKAFKLALKEEKFNLVFDALSVDRKMKKTLDVMDNVLVYDKQSSPISFVEMINKLNINYSASSNYNLDFKDNFFKVNGVILNPSYKEFVLRQNLAFDGVYVDYSEFVLNGNNFLCGVKNHSSKTQKVDIELNISLKKGYYYFKKDGKSIMIENLISKDKTYLNFATRGCKFSFSQVDGLENSVFCCINARLTFSLEPKQEKTIFFNYGESKFGIDEKKARCLKRVSIDKCCEIFNVKIKTKNPKFDLFFNTNLPKKIWLNWLNGDENSDLEDKYLSLKKMFVIGDKNFSFVSFKEIGLKEIGIFNGEYYKKILIVDGNEKFLKVGKTFFYNINGVSNLSLCSHEPICLSFGE